MGDPCPLEHGGKIFAFFHGDGAYQQGLPRFVLFLDLVDHRPEFPQFRSIDHIRHILPDAGPVCGDLHHIQSVDGGKLVLFRFGGTRHARQLVEHAEVVLEGNGGQGLVFLSTLTPSLASSAW